MRKDVNTVQKPVVSPRCSPQPYSSLDRGLENIETASEIIATKAMEALFTDDFQWQGARSYVGAATKDDEYSFGFGGS